MTGPSSSQSDALLRILIANAVDGVVVMDGHGKILIFNAACERLFGYRPHEVVSHDVNMLMPSPHFDTRGEYLARHTNPSEHLVIGVGRDVEGLRKNGSTFPMHLSVGVGKLDNEKMYIGIIRDLTSYREVESELRAREARLSSILETVPDAMVTADENGLIESFSAAGTRLFGYEASEVIGKNVKILMPAPYRDEHDGYLARYKTTGVKHIIGVRRVLMMGLRKNGTIFRMELSVGEVWIAGRRFFTAFIHDITDRQAAQRRFQDLQAELWQASRMNTMGQITSALAHELNQPLTAIANYIGAAGRILARGDHSQTARVQELMDKVTAQTTRAGEIIRRSRDFVENRKTARAKDSLNKVVEEAIELSVIGTAESNVTVKTIFDPLLQDIFVDRVQIQQVLVNLIRNAVEAMQDSPIRILTISTAPDGEDCVQVAVSDTGPGLTEDVTKRLFKPFVTTKATGMGIGLTICQAILESHGGHIWTTPNEGGGVSFRFRLPIDRRAK